MFFLFVFFFFKQKTAYEMRISDWSSDVCSSDLNALVGTMVLRQAEDAFGDRVEQRLVRSARDAARRRVDPARRPVVLGRGVLVEREGVGALQVEREFRKLLARAHGDQLVERAFGTGRPPRLHHQPRAAGTGRAPVGTP